MAVTLAKHQVIEAGKQLVKENLIVRTWGNVSSRLDDNSFLITPSGRNYFTLTPAEIVEVKIADLSHKGDVKPSSEKRIHAAVYRNFPEINFIIHTHQENASILAASGLEAFQLPEPSSLLGRQVPCAPYALPGTRTLQRNVIMTLLASQGQAVLMERHGALCVGRSYEEAFAVAAELEETCGRFINERFSWQAQAEKGPAYPESRRIQGGFSLFDQGGGEIKVLTANGGDRLGWEGQISRAVYSRQAGVNWIVFDASPPCVEFSRLKRPLKPLLDDFAQSKLPLPCSAQLPFL